jgi:GT2 family glycosyltransferase
MRVAALIIGIDGWEKYTRPLIESIQRHEPDCEIVVIDNASKEPYPEWIAVGVPSIVRTERLCYSAAINRAAIFANLADWLIVLSNDVLCTGPFAHVLEDCCGLVVGPLLCENQGWQYLEGWCVCAPTQVWLDLGGWDENFQVSSWEDVDFSVSAMERGYTVMERRDLPFVHLDQRQRFGIVPNYWESEVHNVSYFRQKHGAAQ